MEQVIIFGREEGRIIEKNDISSVHAKVTFLGNGLFQVEDLNSTNGTYVNGYRIKKANVSLDDEVRLSADTVLNLPKEFGLSVTQIDRPVKTNDKDFTYEFAKLEDVYNGYKKERRKIIKRNRVIVSLIRAAIILIPLAVVLYYFESKSAIGITILCATVANLAVGGMNSTEKLEDVEDNFRIRYVCPNPSCHSQLGNNSWRVLHETGKCFRCGAIYNENKL